MKKLLTTFSLLIAMVAFLSTNATAQKGDIKLGAGLVYGSGVWDFQNVGDNQNDLGITVDGYYSITPEIRAGAGFTFYFPKEEQGFETGVWELALNGNYIFLQQDGLQAYGLAGLGITGLSVSADEDDSDTSIGLNLGAGVEYGLGFGDLFGEAKIANIGGSAEFDGDENIVSSQFVLGVGVRFGL